MLKLFKEVLRVGEATLPYPLEPIDPAPGFRGKPHHDHQRCIACAACAIACPPNALTVATDLEKGIRTWSFFVGRCIYCGRCEEVCPTKAMALSQDFELAVANKQDLYESADYTLAKCQRCGIQFAPIKEIEYVSKLLEASEMSPEVRAGATHMLAFCPECRRKLDVYKLLSVFEEVA